MGFGITSSSKASTWMLTTTTNTSTDFVGKGKVQKTMANYVFPVMGLGSSIVVATCSLWKLVTTVIAYTSEFFWKIIIVTSTSLLVSWSYL